MPNEVLINQTNELVVLLKKKDSKGFDRLYDLYSKALLGIISSSCTDIKLAEEILQASFIAVWDKATEFEPAKQHLFGWMLGITREVMRGRLNAKGDVSTEIQNIRNNVTNKSVVLSFVYIKGYSLAEVAKILDISEEMVKIKLKNELDQQRVLSKK